jgi:hypothetical protein
MDNRRTCSMTSILSIIGIQQTKDLTETQKRNRFKINVFKEDSREYNKNNIQRFLQFVQ